MRMVSTLALFAIAASLPTVTYAAHLFLDAGQGTYSMRDTFYVPVRIDTQGECINAVDAVISYDPGVLMVQDVATGDSILTLWTQRPSIDTEAGRITFSGGIPGGYCGRLEGDPGLTNILARLVVTGSPVLRDSESSTTTTLVVDPASAVYLNDGSGNRAPLTILGADLELSIATTTPNNVWLGDVEADTIAPELFEITLVEGPSEGHEKHYITFNTTDKQSGIDHYEVLETDPDRFGFLTWVPREAHWVSTEGPMFVLRDQHLRSKIMVKAVDKTGNERIVTYTPPMSPLVTFTRASFIIPAAALFGLLVILLAVIIRLIHARRRLEKHTQTEENDTSSTYEEE